MFKTFAIVFVAFTALYILLASAVIYHLRQFLPPKHPVANLVTGIFLLLSVVFWLFALYFLFQLK